jgi:hypothetical protein
VSDEWWRDALLLEIIPAGDAGLMDVRARQDDQGCWEYAIVWWRYQQPTLLYLFRDGQVVCDHEEDGWSMLRESILARLQVLNPASTPEQLARALDTYVAGSAVELISRCEFSRQELRELLARYQTRAGRLRALDRLLSKMGIPRRDAHG